MHRGYYDHLSWHTERFGLYWIRQRHHRRVDGERNAGLEISASDTLAELRRQRRGALRVREDLVTTAQSCTGKERKPKLRTQCPANTQRYQRFPENNEHTRDHAKTPDKLFMYLGRPPITAISAVPPPPFFQSATALPYQSSTRRLYRRAPRLTVLRYSLVLNINRQLLALPDLLRRHLMLLIVTLL